MNKNITRALAAVALISIIAIVYFSKITRLEQPTSQVKIPGSHSADHAVSSVNNTPLKNPEMPTRDRAKADAKTLIAKEKVKFDYTHTYKYSRYEHDKSIFRIAEMTQQEIDLQELFFNPYWGLEADFANINTAHKGQEMILDQASEVKYRDSATTHALLINFIGSIPLTDKTSFFAKVGVNSWETDDSQLIAYSGKQKPMFGPYQNKTDKSYGTDMFYGIGFKYDYKDFILKSEIQVYQLDGEEYEIYSIGGGFRF